MNNPLPNKIKSTADQQNSVPAYVLVTPARNEEEFIGQAIESVVRQTVTPLKWVIVNDGSTDKTAEIVSRYLDHYPWIELIHMPLRRDRSFAAKVQAFNAGYERVRELNYDVVGNLDADVSFDSEYCEFLLRKFAEDSSLGVAGTVFEEEGYSSARQSFEGQTHVAGGCQMFRRQCFDEIGGFIANKAGGVDWIAVTTARMTGWNTRAFREKSFFHHRHLGTAERNQLSALFSYGEKDYYLGGHPAWELFRVLYNLKKQPYFLAAGALGLGYLWAAVRRINRPVSADLVKFHRREQMQKLAAILKSVLTFKAIDSFTISSDRSTAVSR